MMINRQCGWHRLQENSIGTFLCVLYNPVDEMNNITPISSK